MPARDDPRLAQWRPLVIGIAKRFYARLGRAHDLEDLIAIGMQALWRATEQYDETDPSQAHFSTYAARCIANTFCREITDARRKKREVLFRTTSADAVVRRAEEQEEVPKYQFVSTDEISEEALMRREEERALHQALAELKPREAGVIRARFMHGGAAQSVARELGVSRSRVVQIERVALQKLRERLRLSMSERFRSDRPLLSAHQAHAGPRQPKRKEWLNSY